MSSDNSVVSPARRSVPWAVRPEVAKSKPASSATTGTRTVQTDGRRPRRTEGVTGSSSQRLGTGVGDLEVRGAGCGTRTLYTAGTVAPFPGSLGWGQFRPGLQTRPPEG